MGMTERLPMIYGMRLIISALLLLQEGSIALAVENAKPERFLTMAAEYPRLELETPDDVDINVTFYNKGCSDETVDVAPATDGPATVLRQAKIERAVSLVSPMELYTSGAMAIIDPMRRTTRSFIQMGMIEQMSLARFSGPLPVSQSFMVVLPYTITLIAITSVCFAVPYTVFMRQIICSI